MRKRKTDPMLDATRRAITESEVPIAVLAVQTIRDRKWRCSVACAESRWRQWLRSDGIHQLPAYAISIVVRETGIDPYAPILALERLKHDEESERRSA